MTQADEHPVDPDAVHDDDQDTDHLARLADPQVLAEVERLVADEERRHQLYRPVR